LPAQRALLNRFGFNNDGAQALVHNVSGARYDGILGINIGKNKTTPDSAAIKDYMAALETVYDAAHYVTLNISSPNTAGLRDWQGEEALDRLLAGVIAKRDELADARNRYVPLAIKIAPDLDDSGLEAIVQRLR